MACTYPFWFLSNFEIFFLKVWFFNLSNFQMAWSKSKMRIQSQFALILWTQKSTAKFFGSSVFFPSFFCFSSWTELNTSLASCEIIIMCYSVCASLLEKKKKEHAKKLQLCDLLTWGKVADYHYIFFWQDSHLTLSKHLNEAFLPTGFLLWLTTLTLKAGLWVIQFNLLHPNISIHVFSILFSEHFLWVCRSVSIASLVANYFLYFRNLNVWFRADIVRRN